MMRWLALPGLAVAAGATLSGCAAAPPRPHGGPSVSTSVPAPVPAPAPAATPAQPAAAVSAHYRCDQGAGFTVRFADDSAFIDSSQHGSDVVLRDAGGVTPQQSVYSNAHLRAEFGLGPAGREAKLHYLPDAEVAHCVRQ
jgi:hypothetical protein